MVTIVIPAYNVRPYLRRCVESVSGQSCREWECIIVDDGSTDGTGELAEELTRKDGRFTVLHQPNGGIGAARNRGIEAACGDSLLFVDSDDWIEYDAIDHLNIVAQYHHDAGRICGQQLVHLFGARWLWPLQPTGMNNPGDPEPFSDSEHDFGHSTGCYYVRSRIPSDLTFPKVKIFEDMLTNMGLMFAGISTYVSPKVVYHYETRTDSILSCNYTGEDAEVARRVLETLRERYLPDDRLYDKCRRFLDNAIKGKLNQNN